MKKWIKLSLLALAACLLLSGCALKTVDELYCLPKRYKTDDNLQSVIDKAMDGLEYCPPQSGNLQVVQTADLDGDGVDEYILLARDDSEKPLKILIFCQLASGYVLMDTIEGYGFGFDFVSFQQLDDRPGVEIIVGRLVSEDVVRSVSVYRFSSGIARHMLSAGYSRMVVADMDADGAFNLFLLNQSTSTTANGTFSIYAYQNEQLRRVSEMEISSPATEYKHITVGMLADEEPALYVTCGEDDALVTDVFMTEDDQLHAVARNVRTRMLGDYYVYPTDVDDDGILEIPRLVPMLSYEDQQNDLLQWYSLDSQGNEIVERYTYHSYDDNWYLNLDDTPWERMAAVRNGSTCTFMIWDPEAQLMQPIFTILSFMDADREELAMQPGRVVLFRSDSVIYAADLTEFSDTYGMTATELAARFGTIRMDLIQEED